MSTWSATRHRLSPSLVLVAAATLPVRGLGATISFGTYADGEPQILTITPFPTVYSGARAGISSAARGYVTIGFTMPQDALVDGMFFQTQEWLNPGSFTIVWSINGAQVGSSFLTNANPNAATLVNVEYDFDGTWPVFAGDAVLVTMDHQTNMGGSSSTAARLHLVSDSVAPFTTTTDVFGGNAGPTPFALRTVPEPAGWPVLVACGFGLAAVWHAGQRPLGGPCSLGGAVERIAPLLVARDRRVWSESLHRFPTRNDERNGEHCDFLGFSFIRDLSPATDVFPARFLHA